MKAHPAGHPSGWSGERAGVGGGSRGAPRLPSLLRIEGADERSGSCREPAGLPQGTQASGCVVMGCVKDKVTHGEAVGETLWVF